MAYSCFNFLASTTVLLLLILVLQDSSPYCSGNNRPVRHKKLYSKTGRHSSVVSSVPTILQPQVWIPSTPTMLFQFVIELWCEKDKNKRKSCRDWPQKNQTGQINKFMIGIEIITTTIQFYKQNFSMNLCYSVCMLSEWLEFFERPIKMMGVGSSVTRLGDVWHFGQLFTGHTGL